MLLNTQKYTLKPVTYTINFGMCANIKIPRKWVKIGVHNIYKYLFVNMQGQISA